jgi:hypothetical protein
MVGCVDLIVCTCMQYAALLYCIVSLADPWWLRPECCKGAVDTVAVDCAVCMSARALFGTMLCCSCRGVLYAWPCACGTLLLAVSAAESSARAVCGGTWRCRSVWQGRWVGVTCFAVSDPHPLELSTACSAHMHRRGSIPSVPSLTDHRPEGSVNSLVACARFTGVRLMLAADGWIRGRGWHHASAAATAVTLPALDSMGVFCIWRYASTRAMHEKCGPSGSGWALPRQGCAVFVMTCSMVWPHCGQPRLEL